MNKGQRTRVKTAALLLPAIVLFGGIRLGATEMGRLGARISTPATSAEAYNGHTFIIPPNYRYRDLVPKWSTDFIQSLTVEHGETFGFSQRDLPTLTIVIETEREGSAEAPQHIDSRTAHRSWFLPSTRRIVVDATLNPEFADIKRELSHQLTHALLHFQARTPRWPAWLVEGMAEHFETTEPGVVNANARFIRALWPNLKPGLLETLTKADRITSLLQYEASYALVAYLLYGPLREKFLTAYKEEAKAEKPTGAVEKLLAANPKFEEEWLSWCKNPKIGP